MKARHHNLLVPTVILTAAALGTALLPGCAARAPVHLTEVEPGAVLPGVSGLAWVEDDLFLAVHDAKRNQKQSAWPRVSLVRLPRSANKGVSWEPLGLEFPGEAGPANDLESAARLPGGRGFLFAESGPRGGFDPRIFLAVYGEGGLRIKSSAPWPEKIENVEAIAVGEAGGELVFLYAERTEGGSSTEIRWAGLALDPLGFGPFRGVTYQGAGGAEKNTRLVSALAVDGDGFIYAASAGDTGDDGGPFKSAVRRIGRVTADENGSPVVELDEGKSIANLDGLKVEAIAVREAAEGGRQLFAGTDDENYGGVIRPLPPAP